MCLYLLFLGMNDSTPELSELLNQLHCVAYKWYDIGLFLKPKIACGTLENIRSNYRGVPRDCLRAMLSCWLKEDNPKPSWEGVVAALKESFIGEKELAQTLEVTYCMKASEYQLPNRVTLYILPQIRNNFAVARSNLASSFFIQNCIRSYTNPISIDAKSVILGCQDGKFYFSCSCSP